MQIVGMTMLMPMIPAPISMFCALCSKMVKDIIYHPDILFTQPMSTFGSEDHISDWPVLNPKMGLCKSSKRLWGIYLLKRLEAAYSYLGKSLLALQRI